MVGGGGRRGSCRRPRGPSRCPAPTARWPEGCYFSDVAPSSAGAGRAALPAASDSLWRDVLLSSSLDAVVLMDADGLIVDFNDEAMRTFGLDRATATGAPLAELIVPPDLRDAHRAGVARYLSTGVPHILGRRIEIDAQRTDGTRFRVELTTAAVGVSRPLFVAHMRDIQGRLHAERRLKATAAVSQVLGLAKHPDEAIDGVLAALGRSLDWPVVQYWEVAANGADLVVRRTWPHDAPSVQPAMFAWNTFRNGEGLPGRAWAHAEPQWIEEVTHHSWLVRLQAFQEAGITTALAFPVKLRGQVIAVIEAFTSERWPREPELLAVLDALGGQLGHFLDELKARRETEQARRAAEEANRTKDEFLSVASHELRTPLNALLGWVHLLRRGRLEGPAAERALDAIERNASLQARLVNDLLDMSRIVTGKFQLEMASIDPMAVVHAAVDVVRSAADAKQIAMEVHPPAGTPALVRGDADRLQQVFWNVLSNAVKFTPSHGRIDVYATFDEGTVTVRIVDTGVGMDPSFAPHAFDRFAQADQTIGRQHGGLGLGLAIARQFVNLHGGTIAAASEGQDKGTGITITLPMERLRAGSVEQPLGGVRMLVVDEPGGAADALVSRLEDAGAGVERACSQEEALGCLSQARFDVLLCDFAWAEREESWLVREIQEHPPVKSAGVRRVALVRDGEADRALGAGFDVTVAHLAGPDRIVADVAALFGRGA